MINDHHSLSAKGTWLLQSTEECRLDPYDDQTGHRITAWCKGASIGYGHLIPIDDWPLFKNGIGPGQALDLFNADLQPFEDAIREAIIVSLSVRQFDALVLLVFNIGAPAFKGSSVVKLINDARAVTPYASLEKAWKAYKRSQGKINDGLINRRACEWKIWTAGIYERW